MVKVYKTAVALLMCAMLALPFACSCAERPDYSDLQFTPPKQDATEPPESNPPEEELPPEEETPPEDEPPEDDDNPSQEPPSGEEPFNFSFNFSSATQTQYANEASLVGTYMRVYCQNPDSFLSLERYNNAQYSVYALITDEVGVVLELPSEANVTLYAAHLYALSESLLNVVAEDGILQSFRLVPSSNQEGHRAEYQTFSVTLPAGSYTLLSDTSVGLLFVAAESISD